MNKKLYPWIPIVGIYLTCNCSSYDTGLNNPAVSVITAVIQAFSIAALLLGVSL